MTALKLILYNVVLTLIINRCSGMCPPIHHVARGSQRISDKSMDAVFDAQDLI